MLAIIPARGGSKGLPGKNIKPLNGKPLIAYAIEAALNAKNIHRVIVSTDDEAIAAVALKYGAEVPFMRPIELASDTALSIDVYRYTVKRLEEESGEDINEFVILQPTSPLRTFQHIDEAIELYKEKQADSVISYCEEHHPIVWHKKLSAEQKIVEIFDNVTMKNRQDEQKSYYPNGAIYILNKEILSTNNYYTDNSYAYIMDRKYSVDIDTIEDFAYCEFLLRKN